MGRRRRTSIGRCHHECGYALPSPPKPTAALGPVPAASGRGAATRRGPGPGGLAYRPRGSLHRARGDSAGMTPDGRGPSHTGRKWRSPRSGAAWSKSRACDGTSELAAMRRSKHQRTAGRPRRSIRWCIQCDPLLATQRSVLCQVRGTRPRRATGTAGSDAIWAARNRPLGLGHSRLLRFPDAVPPSASPLPLIHSALVACSQSPLVSPTRRMSPMAVQSSLPVRHSTLWHSRCSLPLSGSSARPKAPL